MSPDRTPATATANARLTQVPAKDARRQKDRERAIVAAILLGSFVLYAPSLGNDFTWDDRHAAMGSGPSRHPLVATLHPLGDYFASNYWPQHAPMATAYRPLTTLWFALRHAAVGDHALVAHLANVLLHTLAVFGCHLLLRRLGLPFFAAALGTGAFAVHAVHSEASANLVGGAELLALDLGLGGTLLLLAAADRSTRLGFTSCLVGASLCWFAAAASKENGLGWTAFAPLCLLASSRPGAARMPPIRWFAVVVAAVVPAMVYLWLRNGMLARLPGGGDDTIGLLENPLLALGTLERAASGMLAWGYGALLTVCPFDLTVDYGPDVLPLVQAPGDGWFWLSVLLASATICGIVVTCQNARRRPLVALAIGCFVLFSLPLCNIFVPVFMHFAERNYTTPSLGLAILVAALATRATSLAARRVGLAALSAWCVVSIGTAWARNFVWADDTTLVLHEVVHSPRSVRLHLCAGRLALSRRDAHDRMVARQHFATAAGLAPQLPQPWIELGALELSEGHAELAATHLARAAAGDAREVTRYAAAIAHLRAEIERATPTTPAVTPR